MLSVIYNVKFPYMGLHFNISPVAFKLGNISIYWYGIIVCLAFILAFVYVYKNSHRFSLNKESMIDVFLVSVVSGIIGARLYYVLFFPGDTYLKDPMKIFYINQGGLAIYGGLILGLIAGLVTAKIKKLNVLAVLDISSIAVLLGQAIGRWGNFFNQEAFGIEAKYFLGMSSQATGGIPVHPCFLYESLWCLLGFILFHLFSKNNRKYNGQIFLMYVAWYGIERFIVEALRTDSLLIPYLNVKVSMVVASVSAIIAIILLIVFRNRDNIKSDTSPSAD